MELAQSLSRFRYVFWRTGESEFDPWRRRRLFPHSLTDRFSGTPSAYRG